jgi:hypothetical protein
MAVELATPIPGLWSVLRLRRRLVNGVGQANCFRGRQRLVKAEKLLSGEITLARVLFLDPLRRIADGVHKLLLRGSCPDGRENVERSIRLRRPVRHLGVETLYMHGLNVREPLGTDRREDMQS